jgi:hypothetical protein
MFSATVAAFQTTTNFSCNAYNIDNLSFKLKKKIIPYLFLSMCGTTDFAKAIGEL